MCGIAGKIDFSGSDGPVPTSLMRRMVNAIRHRGPDEFGGFRDNHAALLSSRLSIIDVSTGQQPISNEDKTLWIVFNGEVFNYVELRDELLSQGHRFRTRSDTEVIIHAFEEWGPSCFGRFNGQWALAIWDSSTRTLTLSRDRMGVRPLFLCHRGQRLWFASEVKSIFSDLTVPRQISERGLNQVFTYWATVSPTTVFEGIEEVVAGSFRQYRSGEKVREEIYWQPHFPMKSEFTWDRPYRLSIRDAAEELKELLRVATELRVLKADVPVGSYLSGGIDSSVIACFGREAKEGEFRTYSIRFEDAEFDETKYQRLMASKIGSKHEEVVVTKDDICSVFPEVIRHAERPILRTAPAPLMLLSRHVHETGIKAVLTGEGADEVLAGYDLFREAKIRRFWANQQDSKARPRLFERLYPYLARSPQQTRSIALEYWKKGLASTTEPSYSHQPRWMTTSTLRKFYSPHTRNKLASDPAEDILDKLPAEFANWDTLAQAQYLEIVTLFAGYIISSQGDRMLMAHSVEGRFPFLDVNVLEFCNALPPDYKLRLLTEKYLLKIMSKDLIPKEIIERSKQPYRAPDAVSFLKGRPAEYVREIFSEANLKRTGVFDPFLATALYDKCLRAASRGGNSGLLSNSDNMAFVGILSTELLNDIFIVNDPSYRLPDVRFGVFIDNSQDEINNIVR